MRWPSRVDLPPQLHPSLSALILLQRTQEGNWVGNKGCKREPVNSSYCWISRGGGHRKSSEAFSRQTADLPLASQDSSSLMSQRTLGCFSKNPLLPSVLII